MARASTVSGSMQISAAFNVLQTGDFPGTCPITHTQKTDFGAVGGTAPISSGVVKGDLSFAGALTLSLADPTDPFGSGGSATYNDGFTVAESKLKGIIIQNTGAVAIHLKKGTNGLAMFSGTTDHLVIPALACFALLDPTGSAALTDATDDELVLTPASGTATATVTLIYGT